MIRKLICDKKSYNHNIIVAKKEQPLKLNVEKIVQESCEIFCKNCGCNIPRDTCVSLGTCDNHDNFRSELKEKLKSI